MLMFLEYCFLFHLDFLPTVIQPDDVEQLWHVGQREELVKLQGCVLHVNPEIQTI